MKTRRGRVIAVASVLLGLAVLAGAGLAFRDRIAREWGRWSALKVRGKVHFIGTILPRPPPISMACDSNCVSLNSAPVYPEDAVYNSNGTLKNVLVYVSAGLEAKAFPLPSEPVVLEHKGCRYVPHVFGICASQPLEIRNGDPTNHNTHFLPLKNPQINLGMPTSMKIVKRLPRPEPPFRIKCEVHNWESAWCGVFDHPFFAVTDEKGEYELKGLPPGKYTLTAWHEKYGVETQEVHVPWLGARTADFDFGAPVR